MRQLAIERELIIEVKGQLSDKFAVRLASRNVKTILADSLSLGAEIRRKFTVIGPSPEADIALTKSLPELRRIAATGRRVAYSLEVRSRAEEETVLRAAQLGAKLVIVDTPDWKIIPLENLIAKLQKVSCKLYARLDSSGDAPALLGVLEKGVDGLVLPSTSEKDLDEILSNFESVEDLELFPLRVTEILDVGMGERVCIDSTSILGLGEGALVGNQSSFLFLIHNESLASHFTSPRPFRVNAGAVHSYVLSGKGKMSYLSELQSGSKFLVATPSGQSRVVAVGRSKIERRPLVLVRAEADGVSGGVIVQNAETIRFVKADGNPVSVTDLSVGDSILGFLGNGGGRHFGTEVEEFILEK